MTPHLAVPAPSEARGALGLLESRPVRVTLGPVIFRLAAALAGDPEDDTGALALLQRYYGTVL